MACNLKKKKKKLEKLQHIQRSTEISELVFSLGYVDSTSKLCSSASDFGELLKYLLFKQMGGNLLSFRLVNSLAQLHYFVFLPSLSLFLHSFLLNIISQSVQSPSISNCDKGH